MSYMLLHRLADCTLIHFTCTYVYVAIEHLHRTQGVMKTLFKFIKLKGMKMKQEVTTSKKHYLYSDLCTLIDVVTPYPDIPKFIY